MIIIIENAIEAIQIVRFIKSLIAHTKSSDRKNHNESRLLQPSSSPINFARHQLNRNHEGSHQHHRIGWSRSQDPVLVQQGIDYDPEEKRHDHRDKEDCFERVPRTLGARLATSVAVAPVDLATVLAGRRITAGVWHRDAARRGHLHLAQLGHRFTGGMVMYFRRPLRRRLEPRPRIHLKEDKQSSLYNFSPFRLNS